MMRIFGLAFLILTAFLNASECRVERIFFGGDFDEESIAFFAGMEKSSCLEVESRANEFVLELSEKGFPFATVSAERDSSGGMHLLLSRGSVWVWADAENAEHSRSRKETFSRLSGLERGAPVKLSDLERAKRKLVNSGYFESTAQPKLFRDSVRNRIVPVFYMRDLSINSIEGFLSYASGDEGGFAGNVDLALYNMRGTGRNLTVSGESGDWTRSLSASYKEPWILGSGFDAVIRGNLEEDSTYRDYLLEAGISRSVGFFFEFAVLGGVGDDRWTYTLETRFRDDDRVILPRHGISLEGFFRVIKDTDSSRAFTTVLRANGRFVTPIVKDFVLQTSFWAGTLLPTNHPFDRRDLFALGGMESLKGYRPGFFRTRAYGITEADVQWRALEKTAFHLFFEPALHRAQSPEHGWLDTYSYGIGISQIRNAWSFSLYYALHRGADPLDGLLHFGIKALF